LCDGVSPDGGEPHNGELHIGKIFAEFVTFEEAKKVRDEIEVLYR
jgi:hypothetical protein